MSDKDRVMIGAVVGMLVTVVAALVFSLVVMAVLAGGWWGVAAVSVVMAGSFVGAWSAVKARWLG